MEGKSMFNTSGALSSRSMVTSLVLHVLLLALLMLLPAKALLRKEPAKTEVDIVFYHPPEIPIPAKANPLPLPRGPIAAGSPAGAPAPAVKPKPNAPPGPDKPGKSELPPGPVESVPAETPQQKVGKVGILAFKDKIASLAQDKIAPLLGADARYGVADEIGKQPSCSTSRTR